MSAEIWRKGMFWMSINYRCPGVGSTRRSGRGKNSRNLFLSAGRYMHLQWSMLTGMSNSQCFILLLTMLTSRACRADNTIFLNINLITRRTLVQLLVSLWVGWVVSGGVIIGLVIGGSGDRKRARGHLCSKYESQCEAVIVECQCVVCGRLCCVSRTCSTFRAGIGSEATTPSVSLNWNSASLPKAALLLASPRWWPTSSLWDPTKWYVSSAVTGVNVRLKHSDGLRRDVHAFI